MKITLIQGANMEYLGLREPELYGTTTASELDEILQAEAEKRGLQLSILYTNLEGEAISEIYRSARGGVDGLIMNPAGFMYSGFALKDCLKAVKLPYIEAHMTNIDARGLASVTACSSSGLISGFGVQSYILALSAIEAVISAKR